MSYFEECLKKFEDLPIEFKNKIGSLEKFEKIELIEDDYGIDLKFLIVLIAIGEIVLKDIPEYLQIKYKLAEEDAYEIRDKIIKNIFQLTSDSTDSVNVYLESENEVVSIFHENCVNILKKQVKNVDQEIHNLNEAVFFWLSKDGFFQDKLGKIFLDNQETLTNERLLFEDHEVSPTISNWLKDFIKQNGSELFNELSLEQYLINSDNAKKLNVEEKELVRKLLRLYRNLVFFPESMDDVPIEKWEIFPIEREDDAEQSGKVKDVLDDDFNNKNQDLKAKTISTKPASDSSLNSQIFELEKNLGKYSPASLEYKVISQEITRLKQTNK